mgnify:CR=1 FL=1
MIEPTMVEILARAANDLEYFVEVFSLVNPKNAALLRDILFREKKVIPCNISQEELMEDLHGNVNIRHIFGKMRFDVDKRGLILFDPYGEFVCYLDSTETPPLNS